MKQKEKGITLIALVVTIVVLLILAAVSIGMLTGENGIIKQAVEAKDETIIGKEKEGISVGYSGCLTENLGKTVSAKQLENEMKNNGNNVTVQGTGTLTIKYLDTNHIYTIDTNGTIVAKEEIPDNLVFDVPENSEFSLICGDNITAYFVEYEDTKTGKKENEASAKLASTTPVNVKMAVDNDKYYEMIFIGTGEMWETSNWRSNSESVSYTYEGSVGYGMSNSKVNNVSVKNIVKSVKISYGITKLQEYLLMYFENVVDVYIPSSVVSIENGAFYGCSNLTSITVPYSVTNIEGVTFAGCSKLTNIIVDSKNPIYDSRNNCNAIIETDCNELIDGCKNTIIPDTVTSIGGGAFTGCTELTNITIPDTVTNIGNYAFNDCKSLTSITISNKVTDIGIGMFLYCTNLTSITIPDGVTIIKRDAFNECSSLINITIPLSVTSIEMQAFYACSNLATVNYSGTMAQWEEISIDEAFNNNDYLINAKIICTDGTINE